MAEATDLQMQTYANERVRTFAEQMELLYVRAVEHKSLIDDIYARGIGVDRWDDARTDPPHKLQSGDSANPDDMLNFNALLASFIAWHDGEGTVPVLHRAIVRTIGG